LTLKKDGLGSKNRLGGGIFGLIYAEKTDFAPIYAKNYPLAYGFCCTFASEKIKRRCETLSSSFTYTRITMGFR
jgi:hypothetical protein